MTHGDLLAVERVGEASVVGAVEEVPEDDGLVAAEVPDGGADEQNEEQHGHQRSDDGGCLVVNC